ncbi:MAG TPA: Hsp20/alpha crystallin family protein [Sediminispirochaeta sp.]|nr:Hsp20/alpha crystallin family protein [Sediminispirochaeta sp.]
MSDKELQNQRRTIRPLSEIHEEDGKILLHIEMPGVAKDGISIHVENDQLRIYGRRAEDEVKGSYLLRERLVGDYEKIYTIDETIDRDSIEAVMENGVLHMTLKLKEEVKPRKIEIKTK